MAGSLLTLASEKLRLALAPANGGSIVALRARVGGEWIDVLRPGPPDAADPRTLACFPLVPFSNRVPDSAFRWMGRTHRLRPNNGGSPHAIHGDGWQSAWAVDRALASEAVLSLRHPGAGGPGSAWPFPYRAELTYGLEDGVLTVSLGIVNEAAEPAPVGLGLHPYFPKLPGTRLKMRTTGMWRADETGIATVRQRTPHALEFSRERPIGRSAADNCFDGWDGRADIRWPSTGVTLQMRADAAFGRVVLYVPRGSDYFCVEPVSHVNSVLGMDDDARTAGGLITLAPGASARGRVAFKVLV